MTGWGGTSFSYDLNGNLTSDGTTTYSWNARNQLSGLSGGASASFAYDGLGRGAARLTSAAESAANRQMRDDACWGSMILTLKSATNAAIRVKGGLVSRRHKSAASPAVKANGSLL